jgi:nicotinic acid mononucleotide adenylyltransferase
VLEAWNALDASQEPRLVWLRPVPSPKCALLLGAFDPPTCAHLGLAIGAPSVAGVPAAFCLTKVMLDRPPDELLPPQRRLELLDALGAAHGIGLAIANRGTYLEIARAARAAGTEAVFVVGSDKLTQLADPRFYPDGRAGVEATFAEARFIVVRRGSSGAAGGSSGGEAGTNVELVESDSVFPDPRYAEISASDVRRRLRAGEPVNDLVPPLVAVALAGYTRTTDAG